VTQVARKATPAKQMATGKPAPDKAPAKKAPAKKASAKRATPKQGSARAAAEREATVAAAAVTDAATAAKGATSGAAHRVRDLGAFIREQRKAAQLSLRHLSHLAGVSNPYLSQIERGLRKPSADILQRLAEALRISAETLYVQAGILEERDDDLAAHILADRTLSEQQKRALLEVYLSFRQTHGAAGADPQQSETAGTEEAG
jgi:transcriptional regulator with XRE-family HTH domain